MKLIRFAAVLALVFAAVSAYLLYMPLRPKGAEVFVDLPSGTTARAMASKLEAADVVRSRYAFLLLRRWKGGRLKAGEYRFAGPASAAEVYRRIAQGDVFTLAVTVPEGYNLFDIAKAVEGAGLVPAPEFLKGAHTNTDLIAAWSPGAKSLEGYLYPDTYRFSRHATVRGMQETMVRRFRLAATQIGVRGNMARTIVLASLVEKEVRYDDERAMAAGVFENRLRAGMPLQTDPTVIYAAELDGRWQGVIHRSDLDADSPYNTYRHGGLPPGPICSPGAAALRAAMRPAETANLYFVAGEGGHTRFSQSLQEHAAQVQSYRNSLIQ